MNKEKITPVRFAQAEKELINHLVSIETLKVIRTDLTNGIVIVKNLVCDCEFELIYYEKEPGVLAPACLFSADLFERRKYKLHIPSNWPHSGDYEHEEN